MNVADKLAKELIEQINELPVAELGEIIVLDRIDSDCLDEILNQPIDVFEGQSQVDGGLSEVVLLGSYNPMHSPGIITLYRDSISKFFWSLVARCRKKQTLYLTKEDLCCLARLVCYKTYYHELFHFNCDIQRYLFGSKREPLLEEALAVAYSRLRIVKDRSDGRNPLSRINGVLYNITLTEAYKYSSPGYRDWPAYSGETFFKLGFLDYIQPPHFSFLRSNGIEVEHLLQQIFVFNTGFVERII
ncbi:hypothetical protein [Solidesulfovibrio magneticus]|uniref:Uncharacterized protein n=1 Tax=Solidesulfovibrio magneticus (strain ATCC 700980 / DSM 13731 / RS-1) TaxID=573370 RepID=C4XJE1_SOLM1|nr:hypothetical protein [Solidesulfovibrio magneticus]BAH76691.1 hypothetical protein DMR_32000 [Solidesulfovibrio magneticus RS-1]